MKEKQLIVITGPTAVGKTELTLRLAEQEQLEILSCDSRQFYREMTIGTAKPTAAELARAPHHFINCLSIEQAYSAGEYERDALEVLGQCFQRQNRAILSGGSGLYIKALCEGFDHFPDIPSALFDEVKEYPIEQLQSELKDLDLSYYQEVDLANKHRLIRALCVIKVSGQSFSSFRSRTSKSRNFHIKYLVLNRPREELYARINTRVDRMMEEGLLEEVKKLSDFRDQKALQTVGYSELFDFIDGKTSMAEATELVKRNTRRYAKRQLTWFRKLKDATWVQADDLLENLDKLYL